LRRQQAQEENEAKELSVLYNTSCETILALKRSLQAADADNRNENGDEDEDDDDEEEDENEGEHEDVNEQTINTGGENNEKDIDFENDNNIINTNPRRNKESNGKHIFFFILRVFTLNIFIFGKSLRIILFNLIFLKP